MCFVAFFVGVLTGLGMAGLWVWVMYRQMTPHMGQHRSCKRCGTEG